MSTTFVMTSDVLGRGDDGLGRRLMVKFVQQLAALTPRPSVIGFYNSGVNLLLASSPVIGAFQEMERDGVELLACGTCLDHYQIRGATAAGRISDMREILGVMASAERTVVV